MCASCGCGELNEDHGDERHITLQDLQGAADAADISLDEVSQILREAATQGSRNDSGRAQTDAARSGAARTAD